MRRLDAVSCACLLLLLDLAPAKAGPPFVTDDPEPVELGRAEINLAYQTTHRHDGRGGAFPAIDANYGVARGMQLHLGIGLAFDRPAGRQTRRGYGDTELGLKYRFIDEDDEGWRPQVAVYPIVQLPTGSAARGLGEGHGRVLVPLWLQKSVGPWTVYGGGGRWIDRGAGARDHWFYGVALWRDLGTGLSVGAETFGQTADRQGARAELGFNLGAIYALDAANRLLVSAGRGLNNAEISNRFSLYVGWQIVL